MTDMAIAAKTLLRAGFSILPCDGNKKPLVRSWKPYQAKPMTEVEAERYFNNGTRLAIIGGAVSGNAECLDVDDPAVYAPLIDMLDMRCPGLAGKLLRRKTPSGGYHIVYRSEKPVAGNLKLASTAAGQVRIETRGEGGYFLSPPSQGYQVLSGSLTSCPVLTHDEIEIIHSTARAFDEQRQDRQQQRTATPQKKYDDAPGKAFNDSHSIVDLLKKYGWREAGRTGAGQAWTRPGKEKGGSAVLMGSGNLYVFSSNAAPLEPQQSYGPFAMYTMYEHGGDWTAAARQLARDGYGTTTKGERSERGEKQKISSKKYGRKPGEKGRKLGKKEITALLEAAKKSNSLRPVAGALAKYPIETLGVLTDVCKAIGTEGQVSPEMAGQCLLGTAALLVQSTANVRTLAGIKPCSLSLITIAESGEGKSTAEEAALRPVIEKQRAECRAYRETIENAKRAAKARKKHDDVVIEWPAEPYRIMKDGTVEGIRRAYKEGIPSQGCYTSEAAVMLGGYGMSAEHRGKTAGNLNALWDAGEISVARGTEGRLQLYDRRLSIHWLIQPDIAYQAIHDPMLSSVGFWPRFLLACPEPTPPLQAKIFRPGQHKAIRDYWTRCNHFLDLPMGESCSDLQVIESTEEAQQMACRYYERMQIEGKRGVLTEVKPFALRATEQAFRVAGVLAAFEGKKQIDRETMQNGLTLVAYSIDSWLSIFGSNEENAARKWALLLYEWILKQDGQQVATTAILRIGPKNLRSRDRRDTALSLLQQAGLVDHDRDTFFATCEGMT